MIFSSVSIKWPSALFAALLSVLLLGACTSNDDEPETNASIQNYLTGDSLQQVYLVVLTGSKTPCVKEAMAKSVPKASATVILLDSVSLEDLKAGTEAHARTAAMTQYEDDQDIGIYTADVSVRRADSRIVEGSYRLRDPSSDSVVVESSFRARKCPDFTPFD